MYSCLALIHNKLRGKTHSAPRTAHQSLWGFQTRHLKMYANHKTLYASLTCLYSLYTFH